jgi:hypothetical protein
VRVRTLWATYAVCSGLLRRAAFAQPRDSFSDTWVAIDGLGRTLPTSEATGAATRR